MTARQIFIYALLELNKKEAPTLLLEDYNYFINKAINQYMNKIYNLYEQDQQRSDDLRVWKSNTVIIPTLCDDYTNSDLFSNVYELELPEDYLHILNCTVEYTVQKAYKCYKVGDKIKQGARRLTSDMFPQLVTNWYLKPSFKNPYFYITNVSTDSSDTLEAIPERIYSIEVTSSNITTSSIIKVVFLNGTTATVVAAANDTALTLHTKLTTAGITNTVGNNTIEIAEATPTYSSITIDGPGLYISSNSNKIANVRYGNSSAIRMEIRYGSNTTFALSKVYVEYLRSPKYIELTQDQLDFVEDISQNLECPDYVCMEIINELVKLLLENSSDARLQTMPLVSNSIAQPAQNARK